MAAHHRTRAYRQTRDALLPAATANPNTTCWRCGQTLHQHPPHKDGKPAFWTAGHLEDGNTAAGLAPEASTCNYQAGARAGNARRKERNEPRSERWTT